MAGGRNCGTERQLLKTMLGRGGEWGKVVCKRGKLCRGEVRSLGKSDRCRGVERVEGKLSWKWLRSSIRPEHDSHFRSMQEQGLSELMCGLGNEGEQESGNSDLLKV